MKNKSDPIPPHFQPTQLIDDIRPITIIGGHYGSGKTELALNLAIALAKHRQKYQHTHEIVLCDLDIVNPYFRAGEHPEMLKAYDVKVETASVNQYSAVPSLQYNIHAKAITHHNYQILDLGGDPEGATAFAATANQITQFKYHFYWVLNPYRPETRNVKNALQIASEIEKRARMPFTAIVLNPHLCEYTTPGTILDAQKFVIQVSKAKNIPIAFQIVEENLYWQLVETHLPFLCIQRKLLKPWEGV